METYVANDGAWKQRIAIENSAKYRCTGDNLRVQSTKNR